MIFSSIEFILFFIFFILLIKFFPNSQKTVIIISSLFFYSYWNPLFIFLIIYLLLTTFLSLYKKLNLKIAISIALLPLFYFKYSAFFFSVIPNNIFLNFSYFGELPLAISFITFTIIALLIDVKKREFNEHLNFKDFSEFIIYFPQLIAGPILRAKELIPKLKNKILFEDKNIRFGIILFTIGFVKKIFLADNISIIIDPYFQNPELFTSSDLIKGYLLFPFQIYFDFSGYIDMAMGISIFLGIELPINFNRPYLTNSLTNFWRCWHITLSSWFRDYIYIPMGGSKKGNKSLYFNLIFTMTIAGLWHGASLNFIFWGFLNGIFLSIEKKLNLVNKDSLIRILLNCFLVFNLWIVFRISEFSNLIHFFTITYSGIFEIFNFENLIVLLIVVLLTLSQRYDNYFVIRKFSLKLNLFIIVPFFLVIIITGLAISTGQSDKFIYFDF